MKKIYFLKTCDTCKRIMKSIPLEGFEFQEIKSQPITEVQIDEMRTLSGSYESLFSRRAKKYAAMGLKNEILQEIDFKQLILSDYTFLKRPVIIKEKDIFIGSDKKNLSLLTASFSN
ncbi:arsenate reductase family protein [Lutimonas sp.]|uniref:arsenate reductase family protein n=1 Tax=Lutimonas sp. TaxID=1872403 RepID=UPI003D9B0A64